MGRKKQVYYHGTNADHLDSILKHGLLPDTPKIWNDSYPNNLYLWDAASMEDGEQGAFRCAEEMAFMSLAHAKDCRMVVIRLTFYADEMGPDYSGVRMDEFGAVCTNCRISPRHFTDVKVSQDFSAAKLFALAWGYSEHSVGMRRELSSVEKAIIQQVKLSNIDFYPSEYSEWTNILNKHHLTSNGQSTKKTVLSA